jgi:hypothetical protein
MNNRLISTQGALRIARRPPASVARRAASSAAGELLTRHARLPCSSTRTPRTTAAPATNEAFTGVHRANNRRMKYIRHASNRQSEQMVSKQQFFLLGVQYTPMRAEISLADYLVVCAPATAAVRKSQLFELVVANLRVAETFRRVLRPWCIRQRLMSAIQPPAKAVAIVAMKAPKAPPRRPRRAASIDPGLSDTIWRPHSRVATPVMIIIIANSASAITPPPQTPLEYMTLVILASCGSKHGFRVTK